MTDKEDDTMPHYMFSNEALHADWPAYPVGHGLDHALDTLCNLPPGTHFPAIDDIDECLLLLDMDHRKPDEADEYHPDHHHAAVWHEDLRLLRDAGLVEGFRPLPSAEELRDRWADSAMEMPEEHRAAAFIDAVAFDWEGLLRTDAEKDEITMSSISKEGLTVTAKGWERHHERLAAFEVHPDLSRRAVPLVDLGHQDVAVREVAVVVQTSLRRRAGVELSGQPLLDAYVEKIVDKAGINGAFQRHVRNELRALQLCVEREAGEIVDLEPGRIHALLARAGMVLKMLDLADEGSTCFQDIVLLPRPEEPVLEDCEIPF